MTNNTGANGVLDSARQERRLVGSFWFPLGMAMVIPTLASFGYFVLWTGHPLGTICYAVTKLFTLLWPLICVLGLWGERFPRPRWADLAHGRAIIAGLGVGLAFAGGLGGLLLTPLETVITESGARIAAQIGKFGILSHYWTFALFLALGNSLIEEYYWRWFVYGRLRRQLTTGWAILLASLSFAAHHVVVLAAYFPLPWACLFGLGVAAAGAIWCLMYERQRTLVGAWVSHVLADLAILWIGYGLVFG